MTTDTSFGQDVKTLALCKESVWHCLTNSVPHGGVFKDEIPDQLLASYNISLDQGLLAIVQDSEKRAVVIPTKKSLFTLTSNEYMLYASQVFEAWDHWERGTNIRWLSFGPFFVKRFKPSKK